MIGPPFFGGARVGLRGRGHIHAWRTQKLSMPFQSFPVPDHPLRASALTASTFAWLRPLRPPACAAWEIPHRAKRICPSTSLKALHFNIFLREGPGGPRTCCVALGSDPAAFLWPFPAGKHRRSGLWLRTATATAPWDRARNDPKAPPRGTRTSGVRSLFRNETSRPAF